MALSSGLRSGQAPERHVDDEELEISITSQKSYRKQSDTHVDSPGWSKPPERPACRPCRVGHIPNCDH